MRLGREEPDAVALREAVRHARDLDVQHALEHDAALLARVGRGLAHRAVARRDAQEEQVELASRAARDHLVAEALELDEHALAGTRQLDRRLLLVGEEVEERGVERLAELPQRAERRLDGGALDLADRGGRDADDRGERGDRHTLRDAELAYVPPELVAHLLVEPGHRRLCEACLRRPTVELQSRQVNRSMRHDARALR